jgi:hypothetical protein
MLGREPINQVEFVLMVRRSRLVRVQAIRPAMRAASAGGITVCQKVLMHGTVPKPRDSPFRPAAASLEPDT